MTKANKHLSKAMMISSLLVLSCAPSHSNTPSSPNTALNEVDQKQLINISINVKADDDFAKLVFSDEFFGSTQRYIGTELQLTRGLNDSELEQLKKKGFRNHPLMKNVIASYQRINDENDLIKGKEFKFDLPKDALDPSLSPIPQNVYVSTSFVLSEETSAEVLTEAFSTLPIISSVSYEIEKAVSDKKVNILISPTENTFKHENPKMCPPGSTVKVNIENAILIEHSFSPCL